MSWNAYRSITLLPISCHLVTKAGLMPVDTAFAAKKFAKTIEVCRDMQAWGERSNEAEPLYYQNIARGIDVNGEIDPKTGEVKRLPSANNETARILGYRYFEFLPEEMLNKSRVERLIGHNQISNDKIVGERYNSLIGEGFITVGRRRTFSMVPPSASSSINLGATNSQYTEMIVDCRCITLTVVAYDVKVQLEFILPKRYVDSDKVAKPIISLSQEGVIRYHFGLEYHRQLPELSCDYIVGVDLGLHKPYVAVVLDRENNVVEVIHPSERVMQMARKIKVIAAQVKNLHKKLERERFPLTRERLLEDLHNQRTALSRLRREMAILVGQEVVNAAITYNNAPIAIEELGWIGNTMQNGRWNRGEQRRWIEHYANLQGLLVGRVSAHNTSKSCHSCNLKGYLDKKRWFHCPTCGLIMDRDENAAVNIAMRLRERAKKWSATRKETRARQKPDAKTLIIEDRVPVRREAKNKPTPRQQVRKRSPHLIYEEVKQRITKNKGSVTPRVVSVVGSRGYPQAKWSSRKTTKAPVHQSMLGNNVQKI